MTNGTHFWHATPKAGLNLSYPFIWDVTTRHWIVGTVLSRMSAGLDFQSQYVQKNFTLK